MTRQQQGGARRSPGADEWVRDFPEGWGDRLFGWGCLVAFVAGVILIALLGLLAAGNN